MSEQNFTPQIVCELLANNQAQLIDVCSEARFARGALPNAINLPPHAIIVADNFWDRERAIVLYCVRGTRSSIAKNYPVQMSCPQVHGLGSYQNYGC